MFSSIDTCQNKVSADQYHVTVSRAQALSSPRSAVFWKLTADQVLVFFLHFSLVSIQLNIMIAVVHTGVYAVIQVKHHRDIDLKLLF